MNFETVGGVWVPWVFLHIAYSVVSATCSVSLACHMILKLSLPILGLFLSIILPFPYIFLQMEITWKNLDGESCDCLYC